MIPDFNNASVHQCEVMPNSFTFENLANIVRENDDDLWLVEFYAGKVLRRYVVDVGFNMQGDAFITAGNRFSYDIKPLRFIRLKGLKGMLDGLENS